MHLGDDQNASKLIHPLSILHIYNIGIDQYRPLPSVYMYKMNAFSYELEKTFIIRIIGNNNVKIN